ncbi:hypothetical protein ACFV4X_16120 [Streptomyces ardesiacus]|uniref:hypothetical protein n=1 Tax=Streptomyces ardesiacus TaxID=285564 RepID=UPI0036621F95
MSLINGLDASADWVAKDMEAMLRECDALIASKDEHFARLAAGVEKLQAEMDQISRERAVVVADREKAEQVLRTFHEAVEEGKGLRQSRGRAQSRLRVVPAVPESAPADHGAADAPRAGVKEEAPATSISAAGDSDAVVRVTGERSVAVMRIVTSDPDRSWTPRDIAVRLEGQDQGGDHAAQSRARALLDSLAKRGALVKRREGDDRRCVFRLAAAWEAA